MNQVPCKSHFNDSSRALVYPKSHTAPILSSHFTFKMHADPGSVATAIAIPLGVFAFIAAYCLYMRSRRHRPPRAPPPPPLPPGPDAGPDAQRRWQRAQRRYLRRERRRERRRQFAERNSAEEERLVTNTNSNNTNTNNSTRRNRTPRAPPPTRGKDDQEWADAYNKVLRDNAYALTQLELDAMFPAQKFCRAKHDLYQLARHTSLKARELRRKSANAGGPAIEEEMSNVSLTDGEDRFDVDLESGDTDSGGSTDEEHDTWKRTVNSWVTFFAPPRADPIPRPASLPPAGPNPFGTGARPVGAGIVRSTSLAVGPIAKRFQGSRTRSERVASRMDVPLETIHSITPLHSVAQLESGTNQNLSPDSSTEVDLPDQPDIVPLHSPTPLRSPTLVSGRAHGSAADEAAEAVDTVKTLDRAASITRAASVRRRTVPKDDDFVFCPICQGTIREDPDNTGASTNNTDGDDTDDIVRLLSCNHVFHDECITPWLTTTKALCPLCKRDFRNEIPVEVLKQESV